MRTRVSASIILLLLFCLAGAAAAAPPDPGAGKAVVDHIWKHYVETTRLHGAGEFGELFTEDAVIEDCTSVTRGRAQI